MTTLHDTMPVTLGDLARALEHFAPLSLQENYDHAGWQVKLSASDDEAVEGVVVCLDVSEEAIREASACGANVVVAHHPLLFRPLRELDRSSEVGRCVIEAVRSGVSLYAAHTNLDNAPGGVSFAMAQRLGLQDVAFLSPMPDGRGGSGVIGELAEPMDSEDFIRFVRNVYDTPALLHNRASRREIRRVALCGGSGDFLIPDAIRAGADAFLTGEVGYHHFLGHEAELLIGAMGHYESESCAVNLLSDILTGAFPSLPISLYVPASHPVGCN